MTYFTVPKIFYYFIMGKSGEGVALYSDCSSYLLHFGSLFGLF
jgi:hypothetical protein